MPKTMRKQDTVHDEVIAVTYDYLGPSSRRFVTKLAKSHLDKKPAEITREDINELHKWGVKAFALIADDDQIIDEFSTRLLALKTK